MRVSEEGSGIGWAGRQMGGADALLQPFAARPSRRAAASLGMARPDRHVPQLPAPAGYLRLSRCLGSVARLLRQLAGLFCQIFGSRQPVPQGFCPAPLAGEGLFGTIGTRFCSIGPCICRVSPCLCCIGPGVRLVRPFVRPFE